MLRSAAMTRSFGAPVRGQSFEWTYLDDKGKEKTATFRAKPFLLFEDHLAYKAKQSRTAVLGQAAFNRQIEALKGIEIDGSDEAMVKLDEVAAEALKGEDDRWNLIIELTLMLVDPEHHDEFEPLLRKTTLKAIGELRKWLEQVVIEHTIDEVEAVERVDPTSPEPPTTP